MVAKNSCVVRVTASIASIICGSDTGHNSWATCYTSSLTERASSCADLCLLPSACLPFARCRPRPKHSVGQLRPRLRSSPARIRARATTDARRRSAASFNVVADTPTAPPMSSIRTVTRVVSMDRQTHTETLTSTCSRGAAPLIMASSLTAVYRHEAATPPTDGCRGSDLAGGC
jgi:hypothetical protein